MAAPDDRSTESREPRRLPVVDPLSPRPLAADTAGVEHALRALFGQEVDWSDRTPGEEGGLGRVALKLEQARGPALELELSEERGPTSSARLRVLRGSGGSEDREATGAVFAAFRRGVGDGRLDELARALAIHREHAGLPDLHYRRVMTGPGGKSGMLRLGFRCNQDCAFCWQGRDWPAPGRDVFFEWLDELAAEGIDFLTISGGEPTLHAFLPDLIRTASRVHGMTVALQTNAIRMRDRGYCERLVEAGLASALVSFHSEKAQVSDRMTRAPGTHGGTVRGIHNGLDAGLLVVLNAVADVNNCDSLGSHAAFIVEEFVEAHRDNPVRTVNYSHPSAYYDRQTWTESFVPLDRIQPPLVEAVRRLRAANVPVHVTGSCGFPPCLFREAPALVPWERVDVLDARDMSARCFADVCNDCAARAYCVGVRREYVERFGSKGLVPYARLPVDTPEPRPSPMEAVRNLMAERR